jgi:hypothetical protein
MVIQFYSSFLMLLSVNCALRRKLFDELMINLSIFMSSLNYWRNFKKGFRRNLDIFLVFNGIIFHLIKYGHKTFNIWYIFGILYYLLARYSSKKIKGISKYLHVIFHICMNVGNVSVYSNCVY